jgi:hypothetical protein
MNCQILAALPDSIANTEQVMIFPE